MHKDHPLPDARDPAPLSAAPPTALHCTACFLSLQVVELQAQLSAAKEQLDHQRQTAAQAIKRAAAAEAAASAAEADAGVQAARVAEVEKEMGQLLAVVEAQKAASAMKMRQVASLLQDL